MKRPCLLAVSAVVLAACLVGCTPEDEPAPAVEETPPQNATAQGGGSSGDFGVVAPQLGGSAPVVSSNVGGGGAPVGNAAKEKARGIASGGIGSMNSEGAAEALGD